MSTDYLDKKGVQGLNPGHKKWEGLPWKTGNHTYHYSFFCLLTA